MTVGGSKPEQLVAEEIRVHFEGVKAVDGVDLTLDQGEIMGLIGPNGAGKTTFMNAVSHFVPRTSGSVTLGGRDVTSWPPHRLATAGLVRTFQDVATFPELTVFENVELGALGAGLSRRKARERAWTLLDSLGLARMANMAASALPHGEERRVGIARAVAVGAAVPAARRAGRGPRRPREPAARRDDREAARRRRLRRAARRARHAHHLPRVRADPGARFRQAARARRRRSEIRTNPDVITAYLGVKGAKLAQEHHGA